MKPDLLTRLDAGYTKPIATPLEFAEAAAAIRELQGEVEKLKAQPDYFMKACFEYHQLLAEREATITILREAITAFVNHFPDAVSLKGALYLPLPTEHLSQYRDAVIEECAKTVMSYRNLGSGAIAEGVRAMKGSKHD